MSREWATGFITSGDIKLHYYRTGGDKPPLLLAHGFSDDGLCWLRLASVLEAGYDLIMMDARGHGLSDAPDESKYSYEVQADDLAVAIEELGLGKPALLGHSMGAATAAAASANYPDLLSCVLLEDPPWFPSSDAMSQRLMAEMAEMWKADMVKTKAQSVDAIIAGGRKDHANWDESEWLPWAVAKQKMSLNCFGAIPRMSERWQETVAQIECPILLLTGDVSEGALVSKEVAAMAAELWQDGRIAHCAGAGHSIRREQFDCYTQSVLRFLSKHYD